MVHLVNCHLGMHINYSLIKPCLTLLRFKTVFSASRCLSTTNFRTWSITMLHDEQNNMPYSTWNVPGGYFLVLSFAVMFTRFRRSIRCFNNKRIHDLSLWRRANAQNVSFFKWNLLRWLIYIFNLVDITKLSTIMFVSHYNLRKKLHLANDDRTVFCVDT